MKLSTADAPSRPAPGAWTSDPYPRLLAWVLLVGGLVGWLAAFALAVEKVAVLTDPTHVPSCSISPVLSCGSVMITPQAEVLGFPNPFIGVAGFAVVATLGAMMLSGARPARWVWWGLQGGALAGVAFIHWLAFQSLYRINALCPYCMVVWVVTITVFWYVTTSTLARGLLGAGAAKVGLVLVRYHGVGVATWLLVLVALVFLRFIDYWASLLG